MINHHIKPWSKLTLNELYDFLQLRSEVFVVEQDCVYQGRGWNGRIGSSCDVLCRPGGIVCLLPDIPCSGQGGRNLKLVGSSSPKSFARKAWEDSSCRPVWSG